MTRPAATGMAWGLFGLFVILLGLTRPTLVNSKFSHVPKNFLSTRDAVMNHHSGRSDVDVAVGYSEGA